MGRKRNERALGAQWARKRSGRADADRFPIEPRPVDYRWVDDGEGEPPWPGLVPVEELVSDLAVRAALAAFERARSDGVGVPVDGEVVRAAVVAAAPNIAAAVLLRWAQFFGMEDLYFRQEVRREFETNGETSLYHRREGFGMGVGMAFQNLVRHAERLAPEEAEEAEG